MPTYFFMSWSEQWRLDEYGIEIGFRCARDYSPVGTSVPAGSWGRVKREAR
jgi:hypothetical protein